MINLNEYKEVIEFAKRYFIYDLKELEISSAQIFGSMTYNKGFIKGVSDLDICIFTKKMNTEKYEDIVKCIINNTTGIL